MAFLEELSVGRLHYRTLDPDPMGNPYGGEDYFVDGNVATTGDGLSWATAFLTLAEAITASNASIALAHNRWWARRNRIFVCGDQEIDEDLTILPEKCDVIGYGSDLYPFPRILGNHTIAATRPTAGSASACRFINCGFTDTDGTADVFAVPAGCHGLQFIGCTFTPKAGGSAGKALEITNCAHVRIIDCNIVVGDGSMTNIFASGISIEGTSAIHDLRIENCHITATEGITIANGTLMGSLIRNNVIRATGECIDDDSDDVQVVGNMLISDAAAAETGAGVVDCNTSLAVGNRITCSDHLNAPWPLQGTLAG
jgi:hypothetical protein